MPGTLKIALKLLVNDRGKFFTLIVGITFAIFLMMQMTSSFAGIMQRTSSDIINIGSTMWVMDHSVNTERDNIPMPDYILDFTRSIKGVKYAVPIYFGGGLVKLATGRYQSVSIIGLDDTTLVGRPKMITGSIEAIYNDDAFIVAKDADYEKLDSPKIGDVFEINQHRGVIVGLAEVTSAGGLFGVPTLYTTYTRAIQDLPTMKFTLTYVLLEPKTAADIPHIKEEIRKLGYLALTQDDFMQKNADYYKYQTGVGTNILVMTLMSFIVGLAIAGQTFYTFVTENEEKFGALKAMGARNSELVRMILFQSALTGFLGFGLGVLLASIIIAAAKYRLANYASIITEWNLALSFFMMIIIVAFSSYLGIRRVTKIDPYNVFRG